MGLACRIIGRGLRRFSGLHSGGRAANIGLAHAPENPRLRRGNMDKNARANFDGREPGGLAHPAINRSGSAAYRGGERLNVEVVRKEVGVGHRCAAFRWRRTQHVIKHINGTMKKTLVAIKFGLICQNAAA
jgi:hypothetical protein